MPCASQLVSKHIVTSCDDCISCSVTSLRTLQQVEVGAIGMDDVNESGVRLVEPVGVVKVRLEVGFRRIKSCAQQFNCRNGSTFPRPKCYGILQSKTG